MEWRGKKPDAEFLRIDVGTKGLTVQLKVRLCTKNFEKRRLATRFLSESYRKTKQKSGVGSVHVLVSGWARGKAISTNYSHVTVQGDTSHR